MIRCASSSTNVTRSCVPFWRTSAASSPPACSRIKSAAARAAASAAARSGRNGMGDGGTGRLQPRPEVRVLTALPPPMRLLAALVFLAACSGDVAPAPDGPASEADQLLAAVDREAVAEAFALARRVGYTARLVVTETDADGATLGRERLTVRATSRRIAVESRQRAGTLAGDEADGVPRLRSPLETALSEDPPFLDPAARDQYRRAVVGDTVVAGRRLALVEAVLTDPETEQAVRRVRAAVDPDSGRPVVVEVDRLARSVVYDETSRVRVALAPGPDGTWLPHTVETDALVDVPLAPARRVRTAWTVMSVGGAPVARR